MLSFIFVYDIVGMILGTCAFLFGIHKKSNNDEIEPKFLKNQKFSNPLKNLYYNYILKENLNSLDSVKNLLKRYKNNINLIAGDTNTVLHKIDLKNIDFAFIDGGTTDAEVVRSSPNNIDRVKKAIKGVTD